MKRLGSMLVAAALVIATAAACGGGADGESGSSEGAPGGGQPSQPTPEPAGNAGAPEPVEVDPSILPAGVTVEMVQEGQQIFVGPGICYTCHTVTGEGGPLAPNLTDDTWLNVDGEYASIIELVNTGVSQPIEHPGAMLPRAGMPLTDDQVASVAAYVYTLNR